MKLSQLFRYMSGEQRILHVGVVPLPQLKASHDASYTNWEHAVRY
jgi:hypothetical protein